MLKPLERIDAAFFGSNDDRPMFDSSLLFVVFGVVMADDLFGGGDETGASS